MKLAILISGVAVFLLLVFVFILILTKNYRKISKLQSVVKESYSTLEVFLDKRFEIITKMFSYLKEEDIKKTEIATLLNVATQLKNNLNTQKRYSLEASLLSAIDGAYLTLKSIHLDQPDFIQLVLNCNYVQEDIKRSRNYYNNNVEAYNKMLNKFPSNIVARLFKFKKEFYVN